MKILLINGVYNIGSTGKILYDLKKAYENLGHEVFVVYGRHSSIKNDNHVIKSGFELESKFYHFLSLFSGNIYGGMPFSTLKLENLIKKIKPDVVHLHCLNGYFVNVYHLLTFLKTHSINTVLTNHAEFMFTANCGYSIECNNWIKKECKNCKRVKEFNGRLSLNRTHHFFKKMKTAFNGFNSLKVTNVSPWLLERTKLSVFFKDKYNVTILNPVTNYNEEKTNPFDKYNLPKDTLKLIFVTASFDNPEKGGFQLYKLANKLKTEKIHFFVKSALPPRNPHAYQNITFINDELSKSELSALYHYADATLLFSLRETFSMVVAESLLQGTPVIGFKAGGPETICLKEYCTFVNYNDIDALSKEILSRKFKKFNKTSIIRAAQEKYNIAKIAEQYLAIYEKDI